MVRWSVNSIVIASETVRLYVHFLENFAWDYCDLVEVSRVHNYVRIGSVPFITSIECRLYYESSILRILSESSAKALWSSKLPWQCVKNDYRALQIFRGNRESRKKLKPNSTPRWIRSRQNDEVRKLKSIVVDLGLLSLIWNLAETNEVIY